MLTCDAAADHDYLQRDFCVFVIFQVSDGHLSVVLGSREIGQGFQGERLRAARRTIRLYKYLGHTDGDLPQSHRIILTTRQSDRSKSLAISNKRR